MASPALSGGPWGRVHSCILECRRGASCAQDGSSGSQGRTRHTCWLQRHRAACCGLAVEWG